MGRKGDIAKANVLNRLKGIYPDAIYSDKKLYVMELDEGGEMVQISIALTVPKNTVSSGEKLPSNGSAPWETVVVVSATPKVTMDTSPEEDKMVDRLLEELGITV